MRILTSVSNKAHVTSAPPVSTLMAVSSALVSLDLRVTVCHVPTLTSASMMMHVHIRMPSVEMDSASFGARARRASRATVTIARIKMNVPRVHTGSTLAVTIVRLMMSVSTRMAVSAVTVPMDPLAMARSTVHVLTLTSAPIRQHRVATMPNVPTLSFRFHAHVTMVSPGLRATILTNVATLVHTTVMRKLTVQITPVRLNVHVQLVMKVMALCVKTSTSVIQLHPVQVRRIASTMTVATSAFALMDLKVVLLHIIFVFIIDFFKAMR